MGASGGLREARILFAAIAGGVLAMPLAAHAQPSAATDRGDPEAGDPIVPDSEFEEQLPPLDPELDRPLEPLETLEPVVFAANVLSVFD